MMTKKLMMICVFALSFSGVNLLPPPNTGEARSSLARKLFLARKGIHLHRVKPNDDTHRVRPNDDISDREDLDCLLDYNKPVDENASVSIRCLEQPWNSDNSKDVEIPFEKPYLIGLDKTPPPQEERFRQQKQDAE